VVKFIWSAVARLCLPFYQQAYTVGPALAGIFEKKYRIRFGVVRNVSEAPAFPAKKRPPTQKVLLYQGALNEGRGIEQVLRAMQHLDGLELWLAGEGDLSDMLRNMTADLGIQDNVRFLGRVRPEDLKQLTPQAWLGLNVLENKGLSYYYSLANKFFDYVHAGVPQITMNFPEYRALNAQHEVALLLDTLSPEAVVSAVRQFLENPETYARLQHETRAARQAWNWEQESAVLLKLWEQVCA
jgi:glycosyltransferase involved in cell wall biosynthesis